MNKAKILIFKGVFWSAVEMIVSQGFSLLIKLVLARILFPEDFGVIGMAAVFTGFVTVLNDLGIAAALVQKKKEELNDKHFHTAFWTGMVWGIILYNIMCFIVGPLASSFYSEPLLIKLIPILSLGILASPINMIHKAQLTREMNFKKITIVQNTSNIVAGIISLGLALSGAGVWSLAFNSIAAILVAIPLFFKATGWHPKLIWNYCAFKDIFGFGAFATGTNIVNYWVANVDYLLIGKLLSASTLGVYTFAFVLTDTFRSRLMAVINNVMYPMYGKMQSEPDTLKRYYLKVINYNALVIFPIMLAFIVLGEPIIVNIFGDKWIDAIIPLKFLSLAVMVHMMVNSNTALIRGMGRPSLEFKLQAFKAIIFIPTLIISIIYYGIVGASVAIFINRAIAVVIAQYTFNKLLPLKISILEFANAVKLPWLFSALIGVIIYFLYYHNNINYLLCVALLFSLYGSFVWLFMGKELKKQISEIRSHRKMHSK